MAKKLKGHAKASVSAPSSAKSVKSKSKPNFSETESPVEKKIVKGKLKEYTQVVAEDAEGVQKKSEKAKIVEGAEEIGKFKFGRNRKGQSGGKSNEVISGQKTQRKVLPEMADSNGKKNNGSVLADMKPNEITEVEVDEWDENEEWTGFGGAKEAKRVEAAPKGKKETKKQVEKESGTSESKQITSKDKKPEPELEVGGDDDSVYLRGFSSDDQDSSDEDDIVGDAPALDVHKLPTIAKDDKTVKQRLDQAKRLPTEDRGVIYIGRIPHGFYEDQMKMYFTQFGEVTRIRLSRNKKTGRSKHYGFIEFDSSRVAEIVAETMNNYLLMGHILRCKVVPKAEVHMELWVGANRKFKVLPRARLERDSQNKLRTEDEQSRASERLVRRQQLKKRKLAEMGIEYNFDAVAYKKKPKVAET